MTHEDDDEFDTKLEPWFVDYYTDGYEQYPIIHTHGRVIARITGGRGMEVAETYAYLFAAAREMQDALADVLDEAEEDVNTHITPKTLEKVRAALRISNPPQER